MKNQIRTLSVVLLIQLLVTLFYTQEISSIKYSFIGDEYAGYTIAREIATGEKTGNPLSLNGMYGTNPILGSYYQALMMKIFGINIYGWKLSSLLIIFPLGLLTFLLVKKLANTPAAFFALLITDFSFYYYTFFQIGYLNNLSLVCLMGIMYILTFINTNNEKPDPLPYILLGITTGLSWYFYIGKIFICIVTVYLLLTTNIKRKQYRNLLYYLIPAIVLISLSFISTPKHNTEIGLTKTILHKEFTDNTQIIWNMLYPWLLQFHTPSQTHYLPVPAYVDLLTATLCTLGMIILLFTCFYPKFALYPKFQKFLLLFLLLSLAIGITSPYQYPPATRGIHYVPFYILFATYFLVYINQLLKNNLSYGIYIFILIYIVTLNLTAVSKPIPLNTTQKIFSYLKNEQPQTITFITSGNCFNFENLILMNKAYLLPNKTQILPSNDKLTCQKPQLILSCSKTPCEGKLINTFENKIYLHQL